MQEKFQDRTVCCVNGSGGVLFRVRIGFGEFGTRFRSGRTKARPYIQLGKILRIRRFFRRNPTIVLPGG